RAGDGPHFPRVASSAGPLQPRPAPAVGAAAAHRGGMTPMTNHPGPGIPRVDFLVCPSASLLEQFVHRPFDLDPGMVRAVSRHLGRCALCREETDGVRRSREASIVRRPWGWSLACLFLLALTSAAFLAHELHGRGGAPLREESPRPDARMAALARFDPPDQ